MNRFRFFRRGNGWFYSEDVITRQQISLRTKDRKEAQVLLSVKNEAYRTPMMNLALAHAFLKETHPEQVSYTWSDVISHLIRNLPEGAVRERWRRIKVSKPFASLRHISLFHTEGVHFLRVLKHSQATASTAHWLRRLRNYALDLGWLLHVVLPKREWPKIKKRPRCAITSEQHRRITAAEPSTERRRYYEMLWLMGGAQTDIANLHRDHIDRNTQTIRYQRKKMKKRNGGYCCVPIGAEIKHLLDQLPPEGWLFPTIRLEKCGQRSSAFKKLCRHLDIRDITLHCYRYAVAQRALWAGMPEREAMIYLGHKSKMRHHAYAKNAPVITLPLSYYEKQKVQALRKIQNE